MNIGEVVAGPVVKHAKALLEEIKNQRRVSRRTYQSPITSEESKEFTAYRLLQNLNLLLYSHPDAVKDRSRQRKFTKHILRMISDIMLSNSSLQEQYSNLNWDFVRTGEWPVHHFTSLQSLDGLDPRDLDKFKYKYLRFPKQDRCTIFDTYLAPFASEIGQPALFDELEDLSLIAVISDRLNSKVFPCMECGFLVVGMIMELQFKRGKEPLPYLFIPMHK